MEVAVSRCGSTIPIEFTHAQVEKIPYMLIVGENEKSEGTVSVRKQGEGDVGTMTIEAFAERIRSEIVEMLAV